MRSFRGCAMAERESKWGLLGACGGLNAVRPGEG